MNKGKPNTTASANGSRLNDDAGNDRAREAVLEDALSVLVRSDWREPGSATGKPDEFQILLCTGGPAVRLTGTLNRYSEPETVRIQVQDWFQPWADFCPATAEGDEDVLLTYARFYFGP